MGHTKFRFTVARSFLLFFLPATLSGCGEWDSIHDQYTVRGHKQNAQVITVDAKQRHLFLIPNDSSAVGDSGSYWRVCAEAAPDVFSAYAASASGKAGVDGKNISAQFGISGSETASTIERTQTINMLRESMYRTCERFASGAINRTQLVIQAARDQRTMLAILAIEQLTGALRPKPTIISGPAVSSSVVSGDDAAKLIKDYSARLDAATKAADTADKAVAAANKADGDCNAASGDTDEVKATKTASCTALNDTKVAADAEKANAQKALDNIVAIGKDLVDSASASTAAGATQQGSGIDKVGYDASAINKIADSVVLIEQYGQVDEPLMFCIGKLSEDKISDQAIIAPCTKILTDRGESDQKLASYFVDRIHDQTNIDSGEKKINSYENFKKTIIDLVKKENNDANLSRDLQKFENKIDAKNLLKSICSTKSKCIIFLENLENTPYYANYSQDPDKVNSAVQQWTNSFTTF